MLRRGVVGSAAMLDEEMVGGIWGLVGGRVVLGGGVVWGGEWVGRGV